MIIFIIACLKECAKLKKCAFVDRVQKQMDKAVFILVCCAGWAGRRSWWLIDKGEDLGEAHLVSLG